MAPANKISSIGWLRIFIARRVSYFWLHLAFYVILGLLGALVIFHLQQGEVPFVDCLFTAFSACCVTGLTTVDFSKLKVQSQVVVFLLIAVGSQVLMSAAPATVKLRFYRNSFENLEHRSLVIMKRTTLGIYLAVQGLSFVVLGCVLSLDVARRAQLAQADVPIWWFALFHSVSAFNNAGFTLTPNSLFVFQSDFFVLLWSTCLMLLGNTAYPIFFRFVIVVLHRMFPNDRALTHLLKSPRKFSTHLFSASHTRILCIFLISFTLSEFIAFLCLDFNEPFMAHKSGPVRALMGWFQAISTRTTGFQVVNLRDVAPGTIVVDVVLMYVSSYPIISAIRRVSEVSDTASDSSGLSLIDSESVDDPGTSSSRAPLPPPPSSLEHYPSQAHHHHYHSQHHQAHPQGYPQPHPQAQQGYPQQHPQQQQQSPNELSTLGQIKSAIAADSWLLLLAVFAVCAAEDTVIRYDPNLDVFSVLFEIASAYGTVGLSLGYPGKPFSLSGMFSPFSKCVVIVVMIAGRHRSLPRSIDEAVCIPKLLGITGSDSFKLTDLFRKAGAHFAKAVRFSRNRLISSARRGGNRLLLRRSRSEPIFDVPMSPPLGGVVGEEGEEEGEADSGTRYPVMEAFDLDRDNIHNIHNISSSSCTVPTPKMVTKRSEDWLHQLQYHMQQTKSQQQEEDDDKWL